MNFYKKLIFLMCVLLLLCTSLVCAAEYESDLKVGIYYGSGAVDSVSLESTNGFYAGYYEDRLFIPVSSIFEKALNVKKLPSLYYVNYGSFETEADAKSKKDEITSLGIDAFVGYCNSKICVLSGGYNNLNDAEWASNNLPIVGTPVQMSENALGLVSLSGNETFFVCDSPSTFGLCNLNYEDHDSVLKISGAASGTYRGGFELRVQDGKIAVINVIPVEDYLYSVVSREMSPSWNVEALKAQAVCARNFALGRINYHSKYGFDVCRTVCCQAYAGTSSENDNVHRAVDETEGELLLYDKKPIQAVYSSSMGSCTESVENVWGTPFPYLVSVDNPYEDTENIYNGKWTKSLSKARATQIMADRGYNIGNVTNIIATEYTPAGRVLKLKVEGTNGSKTFERESCRNIFSEATYSQKFTVSRGGTMSYPSIYVSNGKTTVEKELSSFSVLSGDNSVKAAPNSCYITNGVSSKKYAATNSGGDPDTFIFDGEGWGHGVGMSQYGAKGMADAGFDYEEILTHYYTGTYLEQVY